MGATRDTPRTLSLAVSSLILLYHLTTAYLCTFLPSDPLYMSFSVTAYAWYGCALAVLGLYGSYKSSPTFLTIFSNHLLIDTILSLVPKLGLVYLFHDLTSDLCFTSTLNTSFWAPTSSTDLHGPGRVIITSPSDGDQTLLSTMRARKHCQAGVLITQILLITVLVCWTITQWGLGLSIRRYAVKLDMQTSAISDLEQARDVEKAFYEEESLADGYTDAVKAVQQWSSWREKDSTSVVFIEHVHQNPSKA